MWHRSVRNWLRRLYRDPFFTLSPEPMAVVRLDGQIRRINPAFARMLPGSGAAAGRRNLLDLIHPEDRAAARAAIEGLHGGAAVVAMESRFGSGGRPYTPLKWEATVSPGRRLAYIVAQDLSLRNALRASEARCASMLEHITDACFTTDFDWRVIRVNRQAEIAWSRMRHDLVGRSLWDIFPEAARSTLRSAYESVSQSGEPAHWEEYYAYPPHQGWFEIHAYPSAEGLAVYFRDIGSRRQTDEKMKQTLQEKEVLLREVHHRVKNNLQVICSMLRLKERNLEDPTLLQALRECRERVMAMAMLHDQLHRAKDFSNINLGEYIRNLAVSLFCSYGVNSADIGLRMQLEDIPVAIDTAIPCGLVVNELVSNSLRHAFPEGRKGNVSLGLHRREGNRVELAIEDDGRGFPDSAHAAGARSLGLWLVELLAGQIDATVERSSNEGTQYRLVFKQTSLEGDFGPWEALTTAEARSTNE